MAKSLLIVLGAVTLAFAADNFIGFSRWARNAGFGA